MRTRKKLLRIKFKKEYADPLPSRLIVNEVPYATNILYLTRDNLVVAILDKQCDSTRVFYTRDMLLTGHAGGLTALSHYDKTGKDTLQNVFENTRISKYDIIKYNIYKSQSIALGKLFKRQLEAPDAFWEYEVEQESIEEL